MLVDNSLEKTELSEFLQQETYLQQRLSPQRGEADYLHLSDLRLAMEQVKTDEPIRILDYGCGGSPYRSLFPNADYKRADYRGIKDIDYELSDDGLIDEASETFDLILSTQVVEHVFSPLIYFRESHRLLKPQGRLICSTHGSFPDHACPRDYQRWTAWGLQRDLEAVGFICKKVYKLTTGPRALLYLLERHSHSLAAPRNTVLGATLWGWRGLLNKRKNLIHQQCDLFFYDHKIIEHSLDSHSLYIAIFIIAAK